MKHPGIVALLITAGVAAGAYLIIRKLRQKMLEQKDNTVHSPFGQPCVGIAAKVKKKATKLKPAVYACPENYVAGPGNGSGCYPAGCAAGFQKIGV